MKFVTSSMAGEKDDKPGSKFEISGNLAGDGSADPLGNQSGSVEVGNGEIQVNELESSLNRDRVRGGSGRVSMGRNSAADEPNGGNQESVGNVDRTVEKPVAKINLPRVAESKPGPQKPTAEIIDLANFATRGRNQGKSADSTTKLNSATRGRKQNLEGVTWDRVKSSKNTWAYRMRPSGVNSATGKRFKPIYVRYLSDSAARIFERKEKDVIKKLVGQWYEAKIQNGRSSDGDRSDSVRAL